MTFKKLALTTILAGGVVLPAYAQDLGDTDTGVDSDIGADVDIGDTGADIGADVDLDSNLKTGTSTADDDTSAGVETDYSDNNDLDTDISEEAGMQSDISEKSELDAEVSDNSEISSGISDDPELDTDISENSDLDSDLPDSANADDASAAADANATAQADASVPGEKSLLLDRPTAVISSDGVLVGTVYKTRTDPEDGSTQAMVEVNSQTDLSADSIALEKAKLEVQADGTLAIDSTIDALQERIASD